MKSSPRPLRVAVEEEYQLVDRLSGQLRPDCAEVLSLLGSGGHGEDPDGAAIQHELHLTQIEMASPVCESLAQVADSISKVRGRLIAAARRLGAELVAAGTHPLGHTNIDDVTPKERYRSMSYRYQQIARDLVIFGCHVHVDMPDRELGVQVMNRVTPWLPALQALTANSPFWGGEDTGYASYRRELWVQWPMAGPPLWFPDLNAHEECIQQLVSCQAINDATRIYWDVRLPEKIPTIEFRVMDVLTRVDEAVAVTGLIRALVERCLSDIIAGRESPRVRPELVRVAMWQAARYGLSDHLLDPLACAQVTASDHMEQLLEFVRDPLERYGDHGVVSEIVRRMIELGGGAARQRRLHQTGDWAQLVRGLATETAVGTDQAGAISDREAG
ncbi:carboxylate-amine ligase [Planctomycetaceae bacterium SH139]